MARYMLDTDTCSYIMKRSNQAVLHRLQAIAVSDVCMSVITKPELLYGVEVSPRRLHDATALQAALPVADHPLPFAVVVAVHQMMRRVSPPVRHRANRQHARRPS
jgi:tRNA(fMet)-specific endonuclease VapC